MTQVAFVGDLGPSMYSMYFVCKQSQTITSLSSFHMFYGSLSWDLALGEDFELLPQIVAPDSPRQESARGSCIGRDLGWEG